MPRVLHTAQALVDMVVEVPQIPVRGGNVNASSQRLYAGGAVNILVAAARSGAQAVHGGAHGTGPNGDLVRQTLRAEGVALSDAPIPDSDTGLCLVLVEPSAERTFVTTYGAERRISVASLQRLEPQPGDLVCVSGYSLFAPTQEPLLTWLESLPQGVRVVLDPGAPFPDFPERLRKRMLRLTSVWTSNADEARSVTGIDDLLGTFLPLQRMLPRGARIVVRDGSDGCYVFERGRPIHVPGFPQVPVDTNGAGDTHTGVLLAEVARGLSWLEAARRANAAAAIKVTRHGPASAPLRSEVDDFLARHTDVGRQ
ncbi:PfkB family carbohydrate kinase [Dermabacteraceae bacterium P13264]